MLILAALYCLVGSLTLDLGGAFASDWDTLRMFLRVLMAVCLFAAALVLVSPLLRRLVLSLTLVLHFAGHFDGLPGRSSRLVARDASFGYGSLALSLEFLYLTNAYHFYMSEPGPASYLWFRLIYECRTAALMAGGTKVPEVDEKGNLDHTVALEYQRFLVLTEVVAR